MNNFYILCAESGGGKTTIQTILCNRGKLKAVKSYTTRKKRDEFEDNHTFVTDKEFKQIRDIVAFRESSSGKYATTLSQVEECDILTLAPRDIDYFKQAYKGDKKIKVIYIKSPIHNRIERMQLRGDTFNMALERVIEDAIEYQTIAEKSDFIINNSDECKMSEVADKIWDYIYKTEHIND